LILPADSSIYRSSAKGIFGVRTPFPPSKCPFFYGWVIVFAATLGSIFSIPGQTMGFSVFTDILIKELGLSRIELSLAYCVGTVASGFSLPWLGRVLDQWGERRMAVASTMATGLVLLFLAHSVQLSSSLAQIIPSGIAAFLIIGVGFFLIRVSAQGVLSMTCRNAIGKWFDHQRGLALAVSGVLVSFSYSIAPRALDWLIARYHYDGAWFVMGTVTIAVMGPLAWLLFRDTPEEDGLLMDGGKKTDRALKNPDMHIHHDFTRDEALRDYSFWAFNLSLAFFGLYATAFTFHIVSLGEELSFTRSDILSLFIPIAFVSVTTNLTFGIINSRLKLKTLLLVMNLGCFSAALGMLFLNQPGGIPAYVIGSGIAGGGFVSLSGIVFPRFYGRKHLGAIGGVNMASMVMGSGIGPLLFGWCHHATASYRIILLLSVVVPMLLAVMSLKADNPQRKLTGGK
jgi:MFS transporter, OFA family, oxalate/formate antiporter